ncbi:TadE/TadG family type IV pilus assembly protein [Paraburkholderia sediminicola]|uniref:TadE/TadG family type IV pilus assembly protein n=1 Tax=Paraburkholderia sediminicola TaxID=458836 RepID=UPI0038BB2B0B
MNACVKAMGKPVKPGRSRRQRGSTAIEFAMVFPLFFVVLYGIITFSMIFVAQQNLTLLAEEGARAALTYQISDNPTDALAARVNAVCPTVYGMLTPMLTPIAATGGCNATAAACNSGMQCVNVVLTYSYVDHPLVPSLPLLGDVLPKTLTSSATIQLNPVNLL